MEIKNLESRKAELSIKQYQSKLLPYAYNILGDYLGAEDVVQEVLNHYYLNPNNHIENPNAYLVRSVINRSINQKKLLRNQKELYPGEWLPTPVFTEEGIYSGADRQKILNYSLLVLLEKLNPKERAVFILKETFDFPHSEIASILGIETENSRQLLKRAKQKLGPQPERSFTSDSDHKGILNRLTNAILNADVEKVKNLLAENIEAISDGGPKVSASRNILTGFNRVSKLLNAIYTKYFLDSTETDFKIVNHKPAIIFKYSGKIYRCIVFELRDNEIEKIFIMVNPDKLEELNLHLN